MWWLNGPLAFLRALSDAFTTKFVILLSVVYFAVKGFAFKAVMNVELPYFKTYLGTSGEDYQKFYNVTMMSFAVKPLIGAITDNVPIFGYHKRYYLVAYGALGAAGVTVAALLSGEKSNGPLAAGLLFVALLAVAATDVLCEGKYSEIMAQNPTGTGSRIVSWIWGCNTVGSIIAAGVGGPLADLGDPRVVLWISLPFFVLPVVPSLLGWIPEVKVSSGCCGCMFTDPEDEVREHVDAEAGGAAVAGEKGNHHDEESVDGSVYPAAEKPPCCSPVRVSKPRIVLLSVASSVAAIGTIFATLYADNNFLIAYIGTVSVALFAASFRVLPVVAAKANLFMFLKELLYLQINGPVDYFYTADSTCVPGGPNFDYTYYQTYATMTTNVACIVAVMLFQRFLSSSRFRSVFMFTTIVKVIASLVDIVLVNRWNVEVGIPDKFLYMLGDAFVYQASTMLDFMPASVLVSRLCPPGLEATMFALLAGFSNFGQNLGRSIGAVVASWLHIQTTAPCNFENLYLLVAVGHMLLPLLLLPLSCLLVPDERMQVDDADEAESDGHGVVAAEPSAAAVPSALVPSRDSTTDVERVATPAPYQREGGQLLPRATTSTMRPGGSRLSRQRQRYSTYGGAGDEYEVFYDLDDEGDQEGMRRRRSTAAQVLRASMTLKL